MGKKPDELNDHPRSSTLKLSLRARAAVRRRDHALEEALLRTIQSVDEDYERELGEALDRYRNSVTWGVEENNDHEADSG